MAECHQCKTAIRGESGIMSEGMCKELFHTMTNTLLAYYILAITYILSIHNVNMPIEEIPNGERK